MAIKKLIQIEMTRMFYFYWIATVVSLPRNDKGV